jgi:hypothetical protein
MPIFIKESPEPLTYASVFTEPLLAECEAYRCLFHDILRYGRRETMGRSILISGHRGSGKTTLVRWAIERAQRALKDDLKSARPLLVPLHGPDLLGGEAVMATAPAKQDKKAKVPEKDKNRVNGQENPEQHAKEETQEKGKTEATAKSSDSSEAANDTTRAALRLLTQALHRAYVDELGRCFAERAGDADEIRELVGQLLVELDHAPDLRALRFLWKKVDKLGPGVLFPATPQRRPDQGFRELVAASAVIEAFQRVAGTLKDQHESKEEAEQSVKSEGKSDWSGKDLLNPLTGLLAGGAAGAGIVAGHTGGSAHPLVAALAAILTAVGSTAALNYSSSRSRKSTRQSSQSFSWDTSIASLDRMLPVMVERIVGAGLAPIFVVDELDKIEGIDKKMETLIHHLKHLVTEKTFFCFLADRSYFEHVLASSRSKAYGREHTFFSERLFVHYRPEDMHEYLDRVVPEENLSDNEKVDREVLPFLLLERAKMHPIDLRRAISDLTNEKAAIDIPVGDLRTMDGYRLAIVMQAAVEFLLDDEEMYKRLRQDPNFARLAYDALYWLVRSWESGEKKVDLKRERLRKKLEERMSEDADGKANFANLSDSDLDLLFAGVKRFAGYLRQPPAFEQALAERQKSTLPSHAKYADAKWTAVRQLIYAGEKPLLSEEDHRGTSTWLRDAFGREQVPVVQPAESESGILIRESEKAGKARKLVRVSATKEPVLRTTDDRIQQIRALDKFISDLTEGRMNLDRLATQIHLLSISPAWPSVDGAIRGFHAASPAMKAQPDPTLLDHISLIESYGSMLDQAAGAIRRSLVIGTAMTLVMPGRSYVRQLDHALRLLAADLRFAKLGTPEILLLLQAFDESVLLASASVGLTIDKYFDVSDTDQQAWTSELQAWAKELYGRRDKFVFVPDQAVPEHDARWRNFLIGRFRTRQSVYIPILPDLLLRAMDVALAFNTDLNDMTYQDYAQVLFNLKVPPILPTGPDDPFLLDCVLMELGFARQVAERLSSQPLLSAEALDIIDLCKSPEMERNPTSSERVVLVMGGEPEKRITAPEGDFIIVVKKGASSVTAGWRVSTQHAVLPVFASDMIKVMPLLPEFTPSVVLSEVSSFPWQALWFTQATQVRILAPGATPSGLELVAPESLDAAIAAVIQRMKNRSQLK